MKVAIGYREATVKRSRFDGRWPVSTLKQIGLREQGLPLEHAKLSRGPPKVSPETMRIEPILLDKNGAVRDARGCSQARLASLENVVMHFCHDTQGVALGFLVVAFQAAGKNALIAVNKKKHLELKNPPCAA